MKTRLIALSIIFLTASGCSNKQIYEEIRTNQKSQCRTELNDHAQAECLEGLGHDYRAYKRERDKLLKQD